MIISSKLSDDELLNAIYKAATAYSKIIDKSYLIIGKNTNSSYFWFECSFQKKHFMHLLGINSKTLKADVFYEECYKYNQSSGNGISISDCTPSREYSRTTINEKISCCADILCIQDAKYMKIGIKNKISQNVDFTYAYGNMVTLGFAKEKNKSYFPITLIPRSIDDFSSEKYKILFVFQKKYDEAIFEDLLVEIKQGILQEHFLNFPKELKEKILINEFL